MVVLTVVVVLEVHISRDVFEVVVVCVECIWLEMSLEEP